MHRLVFGSAKVALFLARDEEGEEGVRSMEEGLDKLEHASKDTTTRYENAVAAARARRAAELL